MIFLTNIICGLQNPQSPFLLILYIPKSFWATKTLFIIYNWFYALSSYLRQIKWWVEWNLVNWTLFSTVRPSHCFPVIYFIMSIVHLLLWHYVFVVFRCASISCTDDRNGLTDRNLRLCHFSCLTALSPSAESQIAKYICLKLQDVCVLYWRMYLCIGSKWQNVFVPNYKIYLYSVNLILYIRYLSKLVHDQFY